MKRASWSKLQLGPPLRAVNDNEEDEVDDTARELETSISPKQHYQHTHARENLEKALSFRQHREAEKENAKTPVTFPRPNDFFKSASQSVERGLLLQNRETPSSTCPSFWNPGNLGEIPQGSLGTVKGRVGPPSSATTAAINTLELNSHALSQVNGRSLPPHGNSVTSASMRFGSASKEPESFQRVLTSKPPIDHSATRRNSRYVPTPEKMFLISPEKELDIVVMRSAVGEETRFKKLTLLGCGGSSKVCL